RLLGRGGRRGRLPLSDLLFASRARFRGRRHGQGNGGTQQSTDHTHAQLDEGRCELPVSGIQLLALTGPRQIRDHEDAERQRDGQKEPEAGKPGGGAGGGAMFAEFEFAGDENDQADDEQADFQAKDHGIAPPAERKLGETGPFPDERYLRLSWLQPLRLPPRTTACNDFSPWRLTARPESRRALP